MKRTVLKDCKACSGYYEETADAESAKFNKFSKKKIVVMYISLG